MVFRFGLVVLGFDILCFWNLSVGLRFECWFSGLVWIVVFGCVVLDLLFICVMCCVCVCVICGLHNAGCVLVLCL